VPFVDEDPLAKRLDNISGEQVPPLANHELKEMTRTFMKTTTYSQVIGLAVTLVAVTFSLAVSVQAQTENVIFSFPGGYAGENPWGPVILDSAGNLYGTTPFGGACCGTVFRVSPTSTGWTETVLRSFNDGTYGAEVSPGVILDAAGNLYGTTINGGDLSVSCQGPGCGVVFELSSTASGPWAERVLHKFTGGADGGEPFGALAMDAAGNLYGTAQIGGNLTACTSGIGNGCGVAFKLTHTATGWRYSVLRMFQGKNGKYPNNGVILDSAGNLYGTTQGGGSNASGVVFQLTPTATGQWSENVLLNFTTEGTPVVGVVMDAAGNLYGSAQQFGGGCPQQGPCGAVFELSPSGGSWTETIVHTFTGESNGDGAYPEYLTLAGGNIYGTTNHGGGSSTDTCTLNGGCGTFFELTPSSSGWNESYVYSFNAGSDGNSPNSGVAVDASGNIFGTTYEGGTGTNTACSGGGCGTVYEIKP
jgi:uncharacterized repeat protein (TIGR03803 family)